MRKYLHQFMTDHDWPQEAVDSVLEYYDIFVENRDCAEVLAGWTERYKEGTELNYEQACQEILNTAENAGLGGYQAQLLLYLCFSRYLPDHYRQAGLPLDVCDASMEDLKWKAVECHKVFGVWGTFVASWFPRFFKLTRFALGRLQFEEVSFPEDYPSSGEQKDRSGQLALIVHIPSSGPLDHESCLASYRMAADFWGKYFHRTSPVICCFSWLLYPAHEEFLPDGSNILKFQRDYEVYKSWTDEKYEDLWRIFSCSFDGDVSKLPEDTSLQRAYKKWLKEGNLPGGGKGILKEGRE